MIFAGFALRYSTREFWRAAYPVRYRESVLRESGETGLDPAFILAVIRSESGFDPGAVSYVEARGLMQITEETFEWAKYRTGDTETLHYDELFEPATNIRYGAAILRLLLDEFGGEREALAAYHAGRGRVNEWLSDSRYSNEGRELSVIPSAVTGGYVDKVLQTRDRYRSLYDFGE
jgi:soluble lytic murein transglycosylase